MTENEMKREVLDIAEGFEHIRNELKIPYSGDLKVYIRDCVSLSEEELAAMDDYVDSIYLTWPMFSGSFYSPVRIESKDVERNEYLHSLKIQRNENFFDDSIFGDLNRFLIRHVIEYIKNDIVD